MRTLFGNLSDEIEMIERVQMPNGLKKTTFKYGKLTVTGFSNTPSNDAVKRVARVMNDIATKYVDKKLKDSFKVS